MKISVVIPMFNASRTILQTIRALAEQDTLPHEVVIVDNNSTDNSKAIVQGAADTFKHLNIILCQESKKGPSAARNKGAYTATGDIVAFTDSDCIPDKCWIKSMGKAFTQNQDLDVVGGIDKNLIPPSTVIGKFLPAYWMSPSDLYLSQTPVLRKEDLFERKYIITFNCAFKKDFFKKLNGFDESFDIGEDFDIALRAVAAGGKIIAWHPDIVVCHQQDLSFKSLIKREVFYTKGLAHTIDRHFRNNIIICTNHRYYQWPNKMGITVAVMPNVPKILLLALVLLVIAWVSSILLGATVLLTCVYFWFKIRRRVRDSGSNLTVKETFIAFFIYVCKETAELYGRIYWSCRYKIICL